MMRCAFALVLVTGLVSGAVAQTAAGTAPAGHAGAPAPAGSAPVNTPILPAPSVAKSKPVHVVHRQLKGDPIVSGNNDIYVDQYGQITTSLQP